MKRFVFYVRLIWKPVLLAIILLSFSIGLLFVKYKTHVPGYSQGDIDYVLNNGYFFDLLHNSAFLPVDLLYYLTTHLSGANPLDVLKVISTFIAVISTISMYLLMKHWKTTRVALITSVMLFTSTVFLITARNNSYQMGYFLLPTILLTTVWLQNTKKHKMVQAVAVMALTVLFYTPGGFWLVLAGIIWKHKTILTFARSVPLWYSLLSVSLFLILISPVFIWFNQANLLNLAGLPNYLPSAQQILNNFGSSVGSLFWNGSLSGLGLGRQAILDVFSITALFAGIISMTKHVSRSRNKAILGSLVIVGILVIMGGLDLVVWLPFLYITIGFGVGWILQQWFTVFPRNPVAKNIGLFMVVAAVGLSVTFQLYRYFVAWPHIDPVSNVYNRKP